MSERVKRWTPGPWRLKQNPAYSVNGSDGKHVAMVSCWKEYQGEELVNEANARLVRAAPELVAVLELALADLISWNATYDSPETQVVIEKCEAELKLAYGETQ